MLSFTVDPRDGVAAGSSCNTCCCTPIKLRPGETNRMVLHYAPWSLPIGYPGLVPGTVIEFEDTGTCNAAGVDNTNYTPTTAVDTPANIDVSTGATGTAPFTFEKTPLSGPSNGTLEYQGAGVFEYTPQSGFIGYDSFTFKTTDADGDSILRQVRVQVGAPVTAAPPIRTAPWVNMSNLQVDQRLHQISFAITMPDTARDCESWRMWIKQPAKDCDGNVFHHYSCFDISPGKC